MKVRLLDLVQRAYDDELAFVSALSNEERNAIGSALHGSAKDLIAHIASWKQRIGFILAAATRGEIPPTFDDVDALNAQTFEANRSRSWSEVLADAERVVMELMTRVRDFSEEALTDPHYFAWRQGRPLWQVINGNAIAHSQSHIAEWYLKRGELARATQTQERLADVQRSLDDSPRNHSIALYNLACFYATSGQHDKALSLLPEALRLNPDLIEWSNQDTDLDSLRNHPTFQAL